MKRRRERMDFFAVLEAKKANAVKPKSKDNDDEVEGVPTDDDEPEDEEPPTDTDDEDNTEPEEAPTDSDEDEEPPADTPQETNEPEPEEPPADDDTEETPPADDTEEEPPTDEDNQPEEEEPPVDDDTGTDTEEPPTDEEEPPTDDAGGEEPEAADGDTQTDDTGGDDAPTEEPETTPTGDMGNGLDPKQLAEDDKKNNILHLRTNFINLYKEVDNFIYRISEGSIDNVIISATYRSVKENLIKIKNSIYTYIARYYDITDYDINLYNYSEFLEAIRINLAMVKVANNCDDDKK